MFAKARLNYPSIIFINKADNIFTSQLARTYRCYTRYLSQFLMEIEGIYCDGTKSPIIIAATNRPFNINKAILRYLGQYILVNVSNANIREEILKIYLKGKKLAQDINIYKLANTTHNYTRLDLKNLVLLAALIAI